MATKIFIAFIIVIFFYINIYASLCIKCHKSHYRKYGTCKVCHRGIEKTSRKKIAHFGLITSKYSDYKINKESINKGKILISKTHCRRCHYIGTKGNTLAQNLNITGANKTGEYIFLAIKENNEFMPDFQFDNNSIINIVKYILLISDKKKYRKALGYPVLFSNERENTFEKNCGNCHKIISKLSGPIGKYNVAPNLSGLFTVFFTPKEEYKIKKWDNRLLKKWLKNPRAIYKQATMPPVILEEKEIRDLLKIFY